MSERVLSRRTKAVLLVLVLATLALVGATAIVLVGRWKERRAHQRIDVNVEDADLRDVMDAIGERVGSNIVVEPDVHEKVTIVLREVPWRDVVDIIAKMTKCHVEERGRILVLSQPPLVTIQDIENLTVQEAIRRIAEYAGMEVRFSADFGAPCPPLDIREVDWLKAIEAICKATGLRAERVDGVVHISSEK